jgi:hypothetical protein
MVYARYIGYNNYQLYDLSKRIIEEHSQDALFREAYDISYSDVLDFSSVKQNLKEWEIDLADEWDKNHPNQDGNPFMHIEMAIPWDLPAPKSMWPKIVEYCSNDVITTEAVFEARQEDWKARKILADLANGTMNDTTNTLTTKIIFGDERHPTLVYTDLATGEQFEGR